MDREPDRERGIRLPTGLYHELTMALLDANRETVEKVLAAAIRRNAEFDTDPDTAKLIAKEVAGWLFEDE